MSRTRVTVLALTLLAAAPAPALADATVFIGANTSPSNRAVKGFAVGMGLLLLGFEFEYATTPDDVSSEAPSLKTGMANLILQTPFEIFGFQPYATAGAGLYRETLASVAHQDTSVAMSTGGGVKVGLIGPVRLRVDYRVFKLGSGARVTPTHRVYAGLNLKF